MLYLLIYLSIGFLMVFCLILYGVFWAPVGNGLRIDSVDLEGALGMLLGALFWPILLGCLIKEHMDLSWDTTIWRRKVPASYTVVAPPAKRIGE